MCLKMMSVCVRQQEADLVTTHELGHNFGAEHDPDNIPFCAPSDDQGGKFVMYPIAVSGDHVNNKVPTRCCLFCNVGRAGHRAAPLPVRNIHRTCDLRCERCP